MSRFAGRIAIAFVLATFFASAPGHARDHDRAAAFDVSPPGVSFDGPETLLVAVRIQNAGNTTLNDVRLSRARLGSRSPQGSTPFPQSLGDMAPDAIATVQADFAGQGLIQDHTYQLVIHGSYRLRDRDSEGDQDDGARRQRKDDDGRAVGRKDDEKDGQDDEGSDRHRFTLRIPLHLPVPASTPLASSNASADPLVVRGAPFPAFAPIVGDRNEALLAPIPRSPSAGMPRPAGSSAQVLQSMYFSAQASKAVTNTSLGTNRVNGSPPDMGGASAGNIAFVTYNTSAALSVDAGAHFTILGPTTIFPSAPTPSVDGGFCCDQHVIYVPQIDRIIWLMQFWPTGAAGSQSGKVRIASASPAQIAASAGTAWTYWDLTSATFNLNGNWMDYPALSYGNSFLYMTINAVGSAPGGGRLVVRTPLSELHDGTTIHMNYLVSNGCYPTQNAGGTVYWSSHNNNHQMRVYSWDEGSNLIYPHDVDINPWPNDNNGSKTNPYVSIAPNGQDWTEAEWTFPACTRGTTQRLGPARHPGFLFGNEIWFAWTATPGGGFPNVHLQVVSIDPVDFSLIQQDQIWNPDYAFAYGSLTTNSAYEVGLALAWGGGSFNENSAVGIYGDHQLYATGTSDDSQGRWGDYVTVRQHSPNAGLYSAETYSTKTAAEGGFEPHYVLFGRQSEVNPPPPPK